MNPRRKCDTCGKARRCFMLYHGGKPLLALCRECRKGLLAVLRLSGLD